MTTAIVGGTLLDGSGADPVPNAILLIEDGRITRAGTGLPVPREAEVFDAGGRTVMPGMIDSHVHLASRPSTMQENALTPPSLRLFQAAQHARDTLEAGITAVRDAGGAPLGFKLAIERGLIPGPRLRISVGALSQTGGHGDSTMPSGVRMRAPMGPEWPDTLVDGPEDVRKATRALLRAGADFIKLCSTGGVMSPNDEPDATQFTREEIEVMVYEARAAGKTCMAHAQGARGILNALVAGVESIEHGIWLTDEVIEEMLRRNAFLVPTLVAPLWVLRRAEKDASSVLPQALRKAREVLEDHKASFRRSVAAGVRIAMGTDSGVGPHGTNAEELERMVEGGLTPMQAIVATTKTAAECIHMDREIGTLEPGKLADVLVVDGDPLADIRVLQDRERLLLIMQGGRPCKNRLETRAGAGV